MKVHAVRSRPDRSPQITRDPSPELVIPSHHKETAEEEATRIIREEFEEVRRRNLKEMEAVSVANNPNYQSEYDMSTGKPS